MLDDNINLKIELFKDSKSGKMALRVHFDDKAPNITFENNEFYWKPTIEEEKILHEAFNILTTDEETTNTSKEFNDTNIKSTTPNNTFKEHKTEIQTEQRREIKPEPVTQSDIQNEPKNEKESEIITKSEPKSEPRSEPITEKETELDNKFSTETNPKEEILHAPKPKEQTKKHVFGFKKEEDNSFNDENFNSLEPKVEVKSEDKTEDDFGKKDNNNNFFKDNPLFSKSDNNEVEDVLKKHDKDEDDESFKEADEKTILDRVLSQKKKGRWKRK